MDICKVQPFHHKVQARPVQLDKACEVKLGPCEKTDDDAIYDIKGPPFLFNPWFSWLAWLVAGVAWPAAWLVWAQFIMAS